MSPAAGSDDARREPEHGRLPAKELQSQSLKSTSVQTGHLFGGFGLRVASLRELAAKDRELGKVSGPGGGGWMEGNTWKTDWRL